MNTKTRMQTDLNGKVALITGASRGLGAYYAKVLSDNGGCN
jgi:NAD(P)-dependent dehydrogenase (short-subunit alcohol dehydrogenase family)